MERIGSEFGAALIFGTMAIVRCRRSIDFRSTAWSDLHGDPCLGEGLAIRLRDVRNLMTAPRTCGCGSVGIDGGFLMKTGTAFVTTLFALASFPLLAQQPPPDNQTAPTSPAASQEEPATPMTQVNG